MKTENPAHAAVSAIVESAGLLVSITGGHATRLDDWECDAWQVTFTRKHRSNPAKPYERFDFPYHTGTGHRRMSKVDALWLGREWGVRVDGSGHITGAATPAIYSNAKRDYERKAKAVAPHVAAVLYGLLLDGEALGQSFNDWCANFGFDDDSISAFESYRACMATGEKLAQMFTREQRQALQDALQDY